MSNSLIPAGAANLPTKFNDDMFLDLAKSGNWLPRLQLYSSNSNEVKEGKFTMNHYGLTGLVKDQIKDLGTELEVLPLSWRPCAIRIGKVDGAVTSVYDNNDAEFKKIAAESELPNSGCFYGLQFLLYIPSEKRFVTFLFGSKSARPEAQNMRPLIGKVATMKSRVAKNKSFVWQVPVCVESSIPPSDVPDEAKMLEEIEKFQNPPKIIVETATPVGGAATREQ